jgi:hypothetical protein
LDIIVAPSKPKVLGNQYYQNLGISRPGMIPFYAISKMVKMVNSDKIKKEGFPKIR